MIQFILLQIVAQSVPSLLLVIKCFPLFFHFVWISKTYYQLHSGEGKNKDKKRKQEESKKMMPFDLLTTNHPFWCTPSFVWCWNTVWRTLFPSRFILFSKLLPGSFFPLGSAIQIWYSVWYCCDCRILLNIEWIVFSGCCSWFLFSSCFVLDVWASTIIILLVLDCICCLCLLDSPVLLLWVFKLENITQTIRKAEIWLQIIRIRQFWFRQINL